MFDFKKSVVELLNKAFGTNHTVETPDVELNADLEAKLNLMSQHESNLNAANQTIETLTAQITEANESIEKLQADISVVEELKASLTEIKTTTEKAVNDLRNEVAAKITAIATGVKETTTDGEPIKSEGNGKSKEGVAKFASDEWDKKPVKVRINN